MEPTDEGVREAWLHGWQRNGSWVQMGSGTQCVGCGRTLGLATVILDEDYDPPPMPDWPFEQQGCPVCQAERAWMGSRPLTVEDLAEYPIGMLRQVLTIVKQRGGHEPR